MLGRSFIIGLVPNRQAQMNLSRVLVLSLVGLACSLGVSARDRKALIELNHQIVGPALETWSLRLEENGKIVEERYDVSKEPYLWVETRCKLSKVESERAVEASRQLLSTLPATVDQDRPVAFDGPSKRLIVRQGGDVRISSWYSTEDTNPSDEAQAFARSWEGIEDLLVCATKK
jgi:hypothetical protein